MINLTIVGLGKWGLELVKSVNKNVRSSTRKLNPILKSIVGKKVEVAIRNLSLNSNISSTN